MKITVEMQETFVDVQNSLFPDARIWKGVSGEGTPIWVIVASIDPIDLRDLERLRAEMHGLRPLGAEQARASEDVCVGSAA